MKDYIISDPQKCSGCKSCELVCAGEKEGVFNPKKSRIRVVRIFPGFTIAMACRFCEKPTCVEMCPREALKADEKGIIRVDKMRCNGCGLCVEACEFGTITMHPTEKIPITCDLCEGSPKCIEYCPENALELTTGESIALQSRLSIFKKIMEIARI